MNSSTKATAGRVYQINVKPATLGKRGLPKKPVGSVLVTKAGLVGDFNIYRQEKLKGDLDAAVMLIPLEMIIQLNSEGWPIKPADLGENFTTTGIPYEGFSPGTVFRVGGAVVEVSRPCNPCANLYLLPYVGEANGPWFLKVMLGRRGWYGRVKVEGTVRKGDSIETLSSGNTSGMMSG